MKKKISVVAGGAGFVGANLVPRLLEQGLLVVVVDNFCRGQRKFLQEYVKKYGEQLLIKEADLSIFEETDSTFCDIAKLGEIDEIWHLAANSDIPAGIVDSNIDLKDTFLTTHFLLQAAKKYKVPSFHFASSSAVYGDHGQLILSEASGPCRPISYYGAMKLASEGAITAAEESYLEVANIFRFPNVVGTPATHGVISDFIKKLTLDPKVLNVLGNGQQQKSYLHVSDLVDGMMYVRNESEHGSCIFNIGPMDDGITVRQIAELVVSEVSPSASISYGDNAKGWVGDVPKFQYNIDKLTGFGWRPKLNSRDAIKLAVKQIYSQKNSDPQ